MKSPRSIINKKSERLIQVHAAVSATLAAQLAAPSPLRSEKVRQRKALAARPPGSKPNRSLVDAVTDRLQLEHPSDHVPPPLLTEEAERTGAKAITITVRQAHILLRAAVPPGRSQRTRRAHVRLRDAIDLMCDELDALPGRAIPESLILAARLLATATDAWLAQAARANQAEDLAHARGTKRARAKRAITAVKRPPETSVPAPFTPESQADQPLAPKRQNRAA